MADSTDVSDIPEHCMGMTGPLNLKEPTESDWKMTKELEDSLTALNIFETPEEMEVRREALIQLQEICNDWIHLKAIEKNYPPHNANTFSAKVYTFGSYRLGVNTKGADIDALLVVPRFITREEFFRDFFAVLQENPNIEDLHAVPEAFVPVLKMKFFCVDIDLLFAKVDVLSIPPNYDLCEKTEQLLRNMSDQDVRSVNGVRVTEEILRLVHNKETFKTSLKVIRMWARKRGLYSNSLGFLGGVTWAILVARICQLFPRAAPATIVIQFFNVLSKWEWPRPIMLKQTETLSLGYQVWDPRVNVNDQFHVMPILTPAYPSQNSTYNVSNSSRTIIMKEISNAVPLIKDIVTRKKSWSDLFEEVNFFTYRHYVVVHVTGVHKQQFMELCGLVESKLRLLVNSFDRCPIVELAHLNCKSYGRVRETEPRLIKKWFIGMQFQKTNNKRLNVDFTADIHSFEKSVGRGMQNEDLCDFVVVKHAKKSQLDEYLPPEIIEKIQSVQPIRNNRKRISDSAGNGVPIDPSMKDSNSVSLDSIDSMGDSPSKRSKMADIPDGNPANGSTTSNHVDKKENSVVSNPLLPPSEDIEETQPVSPCTKPLIIPTCDSSASLSSLSSNPSSLHQTPESVTDIPSIDSAQNFPVKNGVQS